MKVWNDQLVADLFATSTLNYEGISGLLIDFETRLDKEPGARILQHSLIRLLSVPKNC